MKSKYILVTGGAGYIGSHTVISLINEGYIPVIVDDFRNSKPDVIDRLSKIANRAILIENFPIQDTKKLSDLFMKYNFQGVIHFAADKAVGESVLDPLKYYKNNIGGLISLLEAMKNWEHLNFVFSSSCTVYGKPEIIPVTEDSPLKIPESPYGYTKLVNEQMIRQFHLTHPTWNVAILRYFNPIGAHSSGFIGEEPQGIPNNLLPYITQTANGKRSHLTVHGDDYQTKDGSCVRDYIHVMDLADAHVQSIRYLESKSGTVETFNLGTGQGTTVLEMIQYFNEISGIDLPFQIGPRRSGDVSEIFSNTKKVERVLGWKAKFSVRDAIRDAWNYEKQN